MISQHKHQNEVSTTRPYFYAKDKLRILLEANAASPDQLGALLRREGIFSSHLDSWRIERDKGLLGASQKKLGRKPTNDPKDKRIEQLERELAQAQHRAERAEALVELQKKIAEILKIPLTTNNDKDSFKK